MARMSMENSVKVKRLVHLTKIPRPYVRGLLDTLWDSAHATGNPIIGDADSVEIASEWSGDRGQWFEMLRSENWIEELAPNVWRIHDYFDHCPDWVIKRIARARGCDYKGLRQVLKDEYRNPSNSARKKKTRKPSQAKPSHSKPSNATAESFCSEPASPPSEPSASSIENQIVLDFPVIAKPNEPKSWSLMQAKVREYVETYPGIDVGVEIRKAWQWIQDNPEKRKTRKGMLKFLSGWLGRCQDRAGSHGRPPPFGRSTSDRAAELLGINA